MRAARPRRAGLRFRLGLMAAAAAVVVAVAIGLFAWWRAAGSGSVPEVWSDGKVKMTARAGTGNDYLQVYRNGKWDHFLVKGVNIGMSKPGHFPGEAAITKAEYADWFRKIGAMHANSVRVYTIHPPGFYEALAEYNRQAKEPLYLLQGVWADEESLVQSGDAYAAVNTDDFNAEIKRTVDVIHGKASLPARPGHAAGEYRADVSAYVLGWVLGIEWDPDMVLSTDAKHAGTPSFEGTYFRTDGASAFENWLAEAMETTAAYEQDRYGWQRPMSFTNWVTTDLLRHPAEPMAQEDAATVDPNRIQATDDYPAGQFASYHVYPYYPDFFNFDDKLNAYVDFRGENNGYAGYLNQLRAAHGMPVMVAEFGVPASRGMAHRGPGGKNQGFLSESEQGRIDAGLWQDILHERMAGGLLFSWQDEWFKRTWNNMDLDDPDRRPFWSNAQTGEQQFGLLTFDPGENGPVITLDGDASDWQKAGIPSHEAASEGGSVRSFSVTSDERYVYFLLKMAKAENGTPLDATIMIDSIVGQGQHAVPGVNGITSDAGFDFAVQIRGPDTSRILMDSYYDSFEYQYGHLLHMIDLPHDAGKPDNGRWNPIRLALNKQLEIPTRQGADRILPFESYETGKLRFGNADPASAAFDSLADVAVRDETVEIRIPWQLLGVKDPSAKMIQGDLWKEGMAASRPIDGMRVAVVGARGLSDAIPAPHDGKLASDELIDYRWDAWDAPRYHARLKASYSIMSREFEKSETGE